MHVKTSPGSKEVSYIFISCLFHLCAKFTFSHKHAHATFFFLSLSEKAGNCFKILPSYYFKTTKAFGKGSLQLYLIICGRPNQGSALLITFAWVSGFALQVSVVPMKAPGVRTTWTIHRAARSFICSAFLSPLQMHFQNSLLKKWILLFFIDLFLDFFFFISAHIESGSFSKNSETSEVKVCVFACLSKAF